MEHKAEHDDVRRGVCGKTTPPLDADGEEHESHNQEYSSHKPKKDGSEPKEDSSKDREDENREGTAQSRPMTTQRSDDTEGIGERANQLRISGLMNAYIGQPTFSGSWEEDLDSSITVFNTMSNMCRVSERDKLQALPVMLLGDALKYFASDASRCGTFEEACDLLRAWYVNSEKRTQILTRWQKSSLFEKMKRNTEESEVSAFHKFVSKLMELQQQLESRYKDDAFLRDKLSSAVEISEIQAALCHWLSRTSHNLVHHVANLLSYKPQTS